MALPPFCRPWTCRSCADASLAGKGAKKQVIVTKDLSLVANGSPGALLALNTVGEKQPHTQTSQRRKRRRHAITTPPIAGQRARSVRLSLFRRFARHSRCCRATRSQMTRVPSGAVRVVAVSAPAHRSSGVYGGGPLVPAGSAFGRAQDHENIGDLLAQSPSCRGHQGVCILLFECCCRTAAFTTTENIRRWAPSMLHPRVAYRDPSSARQAVCRSTGGHAPLLGPKLFSRRAQWPYRFPAYHPRFRLSANRSRS